MSKARRDNKGRVLHVGEGQRPNGTYHYRWRDVFGKRRSIYAPTLDKLREKKQEIEFRNKNGLIIPTREHNLNYFYNIWKNIKRGIKPNTLQNYKYMYEKFVMDTLGRIPVMDVRKMDMRIFYNDLVDKQGLKVTTLDNIHTVIYQVFELAFEEHFISYNPASNALNELKRTQDRSKRVRRALTFTEQNNLLSFMLDDRYGYLIHPIVTVLLHTGLRVGEVLGLTWDDVDFDNKLININKTLTYYKHKDGVYRRAINSPKTQSSVRIVPMLPIVANAFHNEKELQKELVIKNKSNVDNIKNFIFLNYQGIVKVEANVNSSLRNVVKRHNAAFPNNPLPNISCHSLRHTFATRQVEAGVKMKVIQEIMGHSSIATTMDIYVEANNDLKFREFEKLNNYLLINQTKPQIFNLE